jgi:SAM-dependent methyltransferase
VRDAAAFVAGHAAGAANLPLAEWAARRHEWPPPDTALVVIADAADDARDATTRLAGAGYVHAAWLDAPWPALGAVVEPGAGARLWRAAAWLEELLPALPRGRALDLACGSGRDAVVLALAGFTVDAWDRDADAVARAGALARRHGVALATRAVDLEAVPPPALPAAAYALVTCFRYLHRPLFPAMAAALAPGGHLVVETYREGQQRFGKPKRPRFLLRPGELRSAFPVLEVLQYAEPSPDGGPWTARLLARRPR